MKIVTGKTGTPHVTSRQFRGMMEGIIGQDSYIITHGENLEPELVTNNKLKIKSGMMCHHGNISTVEIGTYDEVTIQNGTQGMKRIDLIVNRYSKVEGTGIEENNWVVIQGTPAAEDPAAPAYTEGNLQEGDLVDDCPVFEAHLDGINVTEIVKLLDVSKNMSTLNADLADSGWISLSPQVKYRKKAGIVTIVGDSSGDVSLPAFDSATTIGTLPEEFRPSIDVHAVGTPKNSSGYMMQIRVFPTGQVSLVNLNPNYNLSFWGFSLSYPV